MSKTIFGLYDDRRTASTVVSELKTAGFTKDHLRFASSETGPRHDCEVDASTYRSASGLARYGLDADEAGFYAEGLRRGGSLVVVRAQDDDAETAVDIMARFNPVRYENRLAQYKRDGYSSYDDAAPTYTDDEMKAERDRYAAEGKQQLREIEESLKVGKRAVLRGNVRVHTEVESEDVEVPVRLRQESVRIDRTDVNRKLTPAEADAAFEEKTIDVAAYAEEPVVEKTAHVTGKVTVGKDVQERTETVTGTVRHKHVEVSETDQD